MNGGAGKDHGQNHNRTPSEHRLKWVVLPILGIIGFDSLPKTKTHGGSGGSSCLGLGTLLRLVKEGKPTGQPLKLL